MAGLRIFRMLMAVAVMRVAVAMTVVVWTDQSAQPFVEHSCADADDQRARQEAENWIKFFRPTIASKICNSDAILQYCKYQSLPPPNPARGAALNLLGSGSLR